MLWSFRCRVGVEAPETLLVPIHRNMFQNHAQRAGQASSSGPPARCPGPTSSRPEKHPTEAPLGFDAIRGGLRSSEAMSGERKRERQRGRETEREQDWNSNRQALHRHAPNQADAHRNPTPGHCPERTPSRDLFPRSSAALPGTSANPSPGASPRASARASVAHWE